MLLKEDEVALNDLDSNAGSSSHAPTPTRCAESLAPPPSYSHSALVFDVHRSGSIGSNDALVTPASGSGPTYFLSFPRAFNYKWELTIHRDGSAQGPLMARVTKAGGIGRHEIEVEMVEAAFKTKLGRSSKWLSRTHAFEGQKGGAFEWRGDGVLTSAMTCVDCSNDRTAATWSRSHKIGKDGELSVERAYEHELDLLVVTGLAMEKWRTEQKKKAGRASAIGGGASA